MLRHVSVVVTFAVAERTPTLGGWWIESIPSRLCECAKVLVPHARDVLIRNALVYKNRIDIENACVRLHTLFIRML